MKKGDYFFSPLSLKKVTAGCALVPCHIRSQWNKHWSGR